MYLPKDLDRELHIWVLKLTQNQVFHFLKVAYSFLSLLYSSINNHK